MNNLDHLLMPYDRKMAFEGYDSFNLAFEELVLEAFQACGYSEKDIQADISIFTRGKGPDLWFYYVNSELIFMVSKDILPMGEVQLSVCFYPLEE